MPSQQKRSLSGNDECATEPPSKLTETDRKERESVKNEDNGSESAHVTTTHDDNLKDDDNMTTNGTIKKKLNQFGDYEDVTTMSVDDWNYRWGLNQTHFHMPKVHPMLQKHIDKLTEGRKKLRIFLPLSGKSLDLKWLLDQGHDVVGCDCADKGCREFFEENSIPYVTENIGTIDGTLFKSRDGHSITMYACDFFQLTKSITGQFDCIWDRGSFVAISVTERQKYCEVIAPLIKENGRYLLDCFLLDNTHFAGPPFNCSEGDVKKFLGTRFDVKKIDKRELGSHDGWGLKTFDEEVYLLKPK